MLNDNLWYAIYTALGLSAVSSGILAYQNKAYRFLAIFSLLCLYIIWSETYSEVLLQRKQKITWLVNIEEIIEFTILISIQAIINKQRIVKSLMFFVAICFLFSSIYIYSYIINLKEVQSIVYYIGSISTILCCFYNLAQIMFSLNDVPLHKQPNLLHTIAVVFFHGTTFILQSSYSLLIGLPKAFLNNITTFLYIAYAGTYFIHTWAFCTQIDFYKLHPKNWASFKKIYATKQPFK